MSQQSDSFSTKPGLSGLRNRKIISGVVEGKSQTEYESSWSPTSPLDFRLFSTFGNPFGTSSTSRLIRKRKQKSWDSEKVGLGLVDSLDDDRIVLPSPDGKNRVLLRNGNPKYQRPYPSNVVVDDLPVSFRPFGKSPMELLVGSSSVNGSGLGAGNVTDGSSSVNGFGLGAGNATGEVMKQSEGSVVGSEKMEVSEDYTCVIAHGPNQTKTTHFYGDQVVESVENDGVKMPVCGNKKKECIFGIETLSLTSSPAYMLASNDFLSFCWLCRKKLFLGKEIYMYRGYRAFCSSECRAEEIRRDEIIEKGAEAKEEGYEAESDSGSSSDNDLPKKKTNRAFVTMG